MWQKKPILFVPFERLVSSGPKFVGIEIVVVEPDWELEAIVAVVFDFVAAFVLGDDQNGQTAYGLKCRQAASATEQLRLRAWQDDLFHPLSLRRQLGPANQTQTF